MDPITAYLASVGVSLVSSAIYDGLKKVLKRDNPTVDDFKQEIISVLNIDGAEVYAEKLIEILSQTGDISIKGTHIFASESITMGSSPGHTMEFGHDSISETKNTKIVSKGNSKIVMKGNAKIKQNDDGSIGFYA